MTARQHHVIRSAELFAEIPVRKLTDVDATPLAKIEASGLVGMGGAGFPTFKKLKFGKGCETVIANAAECEPLLEHNTARLETDPEKVLSGLTIAMRQVGAKRGIVAIKPKNIKAVRSLQAALDAAAAGAYDFDVDPGIEIAFLKDRYPAGDERAIVRDVLGTLLPPDAIPSAAGAVVMNVESLMRVHDAVVENLAVTTKDLTVAGHIEGSGFDDDVSIVVYDVPIGITVREVLAALHVHEPTADEQIMIGGPYMGSLGSLDSTVSETCGGIIIAGPEIPDPGPMGIIVCACGASEERLRAIVKAKGAPLVDVRLCKNACRLPNGRLKCRNPGICPGQAQNIIALKKEGAASVLISHCTDCSNTVMQVAPKLGMRVHHATDAFMRAGDEPIIRAFRKTVKAA
ncbi:proline reductase-associated electron transfer protein PrdC [Bifidobacterium primatium]|uniref:Proline reductase-associated electron transfer protein PrdC n=1 Tax=Bifidobacterium primatium TaxID=2045438 RepID=A0A2M9H9V9_9BIFI|nr:proline reductase-associated electron transfer protein PrdC [Bifidobacterium primatium]PJM73606.1 proline reductase-associated electron transfer protein PrdC [Bifidobacterium primatium]